MTTLVPCPSAFRFFPLLVIYSVVLVCVLGRDFGPMLTAERCSQPPPPLEASPSTDIELTPPNSEDNTKDFTGQHPRLVGKELSDLLFSFLRSSSTQTR